MSLDVSNIAYLAFRMAPFIIVFYFIFQTILNFEIRGFIYAAGLLSVCTIIYFLNPFILAFFPPKSHQTIKNAKCNIISLGNQGTLLSQIPLSIAVYTYTFIYLLMFMVATGNNIHLALSQNIPTLVIFPILIMLETFWIITNDCITQPIFLIITAIITAATLAAAWAAIIIALKNNKLQYTHNHDIGHICQRPSKTLFRCKQQHI